MIDWSKIPPPTYTYRADVIDKQFEATRAILLQWLEQYGYCVYGIFPEFDKLIDKFKEDIKVARLDDGKEFTI